MAHLTILFDFLGPIQSMAATATNADVDNELGNALSMRIRELHAANTIATATSSLVALHALMAVRLVV